MTRPLFFGVRPAGWLGESAGNAATEILEWAATAERLGFDVVFVGDRLLASARGERGLAVYDAAMLDPYVLLAAIAARTTRVRLAPLITVVPFRHPASLAKLTASLDIVSGGRFVFGAGSGWSAPELQMFGVDRRRRGAQLEEGIDLIRRLWSGESVTHRGEFWTLEDVRVLPRPVQDPGPPVWMGSFAPDDAATWSGSMSPAQARALARVGRIADGWVPLTYSAAYKTQLSPAQLAEGWRLVADEAARVGRDPAAVDIIYAHWIAIVRNAEERRACEAGLARFFPGSWDDACATYPIGTPEEIAERIRAQTAGLERVDGYLFTPIPAGEGQLEAIASELRPLLGRDGTELGRGVAARTAPA
jgi:probable F420-dependent oxidoreductase